MEATHPTPTSLFNADRRWLPWLALWALLVLVQIVTPLWYATPDTCTYLSLARSFATTGHFTNQGGQNLIFPVGYPLLISPAYRLGTQPFLAITTIHAVLTTVYLAGVYVWVRRYAAEAALPIALLAVGNVVVLALFRRPLSEVAFMTVLIWLGNVLCQVVPECSFKSVSGAAALLLLLALIRPTGIVLVGGVAVYLFVAFRHGQLSLRGAIGVFAALTVPALLGLASFLAYDRYLSGGATGWTNLDVFTRSSTQPATEVLTDSLALQCLDGLRIRVSEVGRLTIPGMFNAYGDTWLDFNLLVYAPLFAVCCYGWVRLVRRGSDALAWTAPWYFALYVYWPFNQSGRFFAPLLPLLLLCIYLGLERLGRWRVQALGVLVAAHLAVALGHWRFVDWPRAVADAQRWPDVTALAHSIPPDSGAVQVAPRLGNTHFFLGYALDRPVTIGAEPKAPVRWHIVPPQELPPTDFTVQQVVGPYRLLHRSDQ